MFGIVFVQEHQNYIGRDAKLGPVVASLKREVDYQGSLVRVIYRTQKDTVYRNINTSQMQPKEPEEYIRVRELVGGKWVWLNACVYTA